ncbi:E3 ubiquitin-protein ligase TRIM71-like isoform X7 [Mytilus californianus]|uniref:E3 ubiquitin-protein ligase TRIM71-like isoform X7 n=1 Tax=Mytilus californianus TaxID=6549 RepID=UPI0022460E32|nr:E3 ubiquitin-protein ligase TRIM71-like isoform X7 [Mytilus californianus]
MAQAASKTCEICISASGSQYCLECEQYFCENCKIFHKRQKGTINHQFQSSSDVIPEGKSKCPDHKEDLCFLCNTCNVAVCSSCVTGSHTGHAFSKLMDSITKLKEKIKKDLHRKVHEKTQNLKKIEEGLKAFDVNVEVVVKAITEEGTNIKTMVDKCIAEMIASVKDQSKTEKDKLTKIMADSKMNLKAGSDIGNKIYELEKTRKDGQLLQSLQKLTNDIAKLMVESLPEFPNIQYTAKPVTDNDIKQLFGIFKISGVRTQHIGNREKGLPNTKSDYEKDTKPKEEG